MKKNTVLILTSSAIIVIVLVVIIFATLSRIRTSPDILRVGYMRISSHAPFVYAYENDIFKKYNLKVRKTIYPTTASLLSALEHNHIDVAFQVTPDLAWESAKKTNNDYYVYFVAQSTRSKPMDGFYAMEELNAKNLSGATVGHFPGNTGLGMTKAIMKQQYGLDEFEYNLIEVKPEMQVMFLKTGKIKALFTYEPMGVVAESQGAKNVLKAPVETVIGIGLDPWSGGVGIFSKELVEFRREIAVNFQKAIKESFEILNDSLNISVYAKALTDLQPGLTDSLARRVPNIALVFPNKENIDEIDHWLQYQFGIYQNLDIIQSSDIRLNVFKPYEN